MNMQAPKGTRDILGMDVRAWQWLEENIRHTCDTFGFGELRTPTFEHTELFLRGVGETTDVVQKEMYTFDDKGGRSITLRPEGTAGAARAFIEHGMHNLPLPVKLYYIGPIFRYENPQAGRYRQHFQFGVECFGSEHPAVEAEIISVGHSLLQRLGIKDVTLHINSLGCADCYSKYREMLKAFVGDNLGNLCGDCQRRFHQNPLRALDCKVEKCKTIMKKAPATLEALDEECNDHFEAVLALLYGMGINYVVDPKIVRGLDYYTRTVFEFMTDGLPTVIGGGRYDGMIEQIGGNPTPAVGFGMGMDRLLILLKNQGLIPEQFLSIPCDIYIGHAGDAGYQKSQLLVNGLRSMGVAAESDLLKRSVKAQMKYAGKRGARFSMIIGDNELAENKAKIKNMDTGEQEAVSLEIEALMSAIGIITTEIYRNL